MISNPDSDSGKSNAPQDDWSGGEGSRHWDLVYGWKDLPSAGIEPLVQRNWIVVFNRTVPFGILFQLMYSWGPFFGIYQRGPIHPFILSSR